MHKKHRSNYNGKMVKTCVDCGKQFAISESVQKYMRDNGLSLPKRCKDCRTKRKDRLSESIVCSDCGELFTFTASEQEYYRDHNLVRPKRCKKCRDIRRKARSDGQDIAKEDKQSE